MQNGKNETVNNTETLFESVFQYSPDAYLLVNEKRAITHVNKAFCQLFGYCPEDVTGQPVTILYESREEYERQGQHRLQMSEEKRLMPQIANLCKKGGVPFLVEMLNAPLRQEDGTVLGFLGIVRDVSGRLKFDTDKQRLQNQLLRSTKLEAMGQLTSGVAHNFNNILSSVLGYATLCQRELDGGDKEKVANFLDQIKASGERARDLIEQMLAFSNSERFVSSEPVSLEVMLREVTAQVRPVISSGIDIQTDFVADAKTGLDMLSMQQLLLVLCVNAHDAMQGEGVIRMRIEDPHTVSSYCHACHQDVNGQFVSVVVEDSGEGIDESIREQVFEPFFTTRDVGGGSGMGLASVHGILHSLGGHVNVSESTLGGAQIELFFPVVGATMAKQKERSLSGTFDLAGRHIMVVDDEEMLLRLIKELLEDKGAIVEAYPTAVLALEAFKLNPDLYDIVLTDQTMPGMLGSNLLIQIKAIREGTPVVLCTGYSDRLDETRAFELGASGYIAKPFDPDEMLSSVYDLICDH